MLVSQPFTFGTSCAGATRKRQGGAAAAKNVPVTVEQGMNMLTMLVRFMYITGRELEYDLATVENLESIRSWFEELQSNNPTATSHVKPFHDTINRRSGLSPSGDY